jgi:ribose 1,5-bisphosphokinase
MGPSGAGKDTLLAIARARLAREGFAFAHRYITRQPVTDDENYVSLTREEFAARRDAGLFAFAWNARGVDYGIGREIALWREAGLTAVVSGSRADWLGGAPARAGAVPILVDAAPATLAARLAARGREDAPQIAARLARAGAFDLEAPGLVRIDNDGAPETAAAALVTALRAIRDGSAAAA